MMYLCNPPLMSGLRSIISIWNYGPFPPIRCFGFCGDPFRAAGSASKAQSWLAQSDGVLALQLTSPQLNRVRAKLLQEVGPYAAVKAHSPLFERHWEADT